MKTPLSSILLVLLSSFIGSFGAVFLKSGAHRLDRERLITIILNWRLAAGIASFLISSVFFVAAIKNGELTILYPMNALAYVWTLFWSRTFFHEPLNRNKFFGLGLILAGIVVLNLGNK